MTSQFDMQDTRDLATKMFYNIADAKADKAGCDRIWIFKGHLDAGGLPRHIVEQVNIAGFSPIVVKASSLAFQWVGLKALVN